MNSVTYSGVRPGALSPTGMLSRKLAWLAYRMDCTWQTNEKRKQSRRHRYLRVDAMLLLSPYTKSFSVLLEPPDVLLTKAPMMELRVMAVDASNVEAKMLLRRVCTARMPFFKLSCRFIKTANPLRN
jgi:hypothetical protein